jgi:hypothetical protein
MGVYLGASSLYYIWRRTPNLEAEKDSLITATWLVSMYGMTQLSAAFYPGCLPVDPEFGEGFPQFYICMVVFCLVGAGFWLESRRMMMEKSNVRKK